MRLLRHFSGSVLILGSLLCAAQARVLIGTQSTTPSSRAVSHATAELRGRVTDPSGAIIAHAKVTVTASHGVVRQTETNQKGEFRFAALPAGPASLSITAAGFSPYLQDQLPLQAGMPTMLSIHLLLGTQQQQVVVHGQSTDVGLETADRAGAVVISGKSLNALSDDPDQFETDLQALAGPSVGGGGGTVYIDGFSRGDIPPKSAIREVRVNNDPFSAKYQHPGYGRIEILTKPGSDTYHGRIFFDGNSSKFNALNPFIKAAGSTAPPYHSTIMSGDLGGPVGKKTSFFVALERRNINQVNVINTDILGPDLTLQHELASVPNPQRRTSMAPRVDFQLTPNNTLTTRYEYQTESDSNNGIGTQSLPSQAFDYVRHHHNLQISDTQILGPQVVNETRFQYLHFTNLRTPHNNQPTIDVLGAFTGGGSNLGTWDRSETHDDGREDLSIDQGPHQIELGGEVRSVSRTETTTQNFNGTFTFNSLSDYQATEQALQQGHTMTQIQAAGHGPSQFSITAGNPLAHVLAVNSSLYLQDAWKLRRNLMVSYGLRFETENWIHDHSDWAPRLGLAWGLGGGDSPKTVVRAGFGFFFERFDDDQMIIAERMNGVNQRQYLVPTPDFFTPSATPDPSQFDANSGSFPTVYRLAPTLHSPFVMESSIGIERQFGSSATLTTTFLHARGEDQFLTDDMNAPLPGSYDPANPASGVRPFGLAAGNIYQYQSVGIYRQNQFTANFKFHPGKSLFLFGYYNWNDAHSDTAGVDSFPTNPWNIAADYAAAPYDIHQRFFMGGTVNMPWGVSFSPFLVAHSGTPYSITLGQDLFGTGIHNGRPALAGPTTPAADVRQTPYGVFNVHPSPGEALIAPNTEVGPGAFSLNFRVGKTFAFGGAKPGSARGTKGDSEQRYRLTLGVQTRNLFNTVNLGTPVGNLNSPLFGHSITLAGEGFSSGAANRRVELQAELSF